MPESSRSDRATQTLDRLTVNYIPQEDRIRVNACLANGDTVVLWFTQRIMRNLVSGLTNWLESGDSPVKTPKTVPVPPASGQQLAREQASAQMHMRPSQPVKASETANEVLVTSLEVRSRKGLLILVIPLDDENAGTASFSRTTLNQWLGILYTQYLQANWPCDEWPAWFREAQTRPAKVLGAGVH